MHTMRGLNAFVTVLLGAFAGAAVFFLVALGCSATIGSPADLNAAVAIGAGMVLAGGIVGGILGYWRWRRAGSPDDPPLF
jgi:hypothetical protein